jgi:hypothetical protein
MQFKALLKRLLQSREPEPKMVDIEARKLTSILTLVSVIFATQTPTFKGPVSYTTLFPPNAQSTATAKTSGSTLPSTIARSHSTTGSSSSSSSTVASTTQMLTTSTPTSTKPTSATVAPVSTTSATPTATPAKGGMSGGAKAGLAFGIILIILLVVAGAVAFYRKRKAALADGRRNLDDEKNFLDGGRKPDTLPPFATPMQSYPQSQPQRQTPQPVAAFAGAQYGTPQVEQRDVHARPLSFEAAPEALPIAKQTPQLAPQLSLRGVSTFGNSFQNEQPTNPFENPANDIASRPGTAQATDMNNPFGQHAEVPSTPQIVPLPASPVVANQGRISVPPQAADFPMPDTAPEAQDSVSHEPEAAVPVPAPKASSSVPVTDSTGAAAIMAATTAAAAIKPRSGASTPVGPLSEVVHRVQLEFKPNMPDELGIQAGQLVRILHEYDDGWVSTFIPFPLFYINVYRFSLFEWIVPHKVSFHEPVFLNTRLSQSAPLHLLVIAHEAHLCVVLNSLDQVATHQIHMAQLPHELLAHHRDEIPLAH